eukprot:TRINITY_DN80711_c0_g1_i1.p1 TRINITY_DN80711_c0_g1~~TRINITY_DN80711_c0_g1_i1.p1  ORF type:complete len:194 (+),score=33.43 TRINITY_DN80711_c0_g1_i1:131-712(+)
MACKMRIRRCTSGVCLLAAAAVALGLTLNSSFVGGTIPQAPKVRSFAIQRKASSEGSLPSILAAAHANDVEKIKALAADGEDIDSQDMYGWTALRYAVRGRNPEAVEALLELGANCNLASQSGRTPLMSAAGNGLSTMIRVLLKNGADRFAKDSAGRTAYDHSMRGGDTGCTACREMLAIGEHEVPEITVEGL